MAASRGTSLLTGTSKRFLKSLLYFTILLFLFTLSSFIIMLSKSLSSKLISEPVNTLKIWSSLYSILQFCGYWLLKRRQDTDSMHAGGKRTKVGSSVVHDFMSTIKAGLKYGTLLCLSCAIFHIFAVLYGAPLTETIEETAMFGMLLTTLVTVPAMCILGTDGEKYSRIIESRSPHPGLETCLCYVVFFSLLGGWLGAFPIPLDWDRPWQKWPVSCCIGALSGHVLGMAASVIHCGRRLGEESDLSFTRSKSKNY